MMWQAYFSLGAREITFNGKSFASAARQEFGGSSQNTEMAVHASIKDIKIKIYCIYDI